MSWLRSFNSSIKGVITRFHKPIVVGVIWKFSDAIDYALETTRIWKKHPDKLLRKTQINFFSLTAWAAQAAQTEEFMFQNVA